MALWTDDPQKQAIIENYFSSFSPLCKKIIQVKSSVKNLYDDNEWKEMSAEKRDQIIDEQFITSEIKCRYKNGLSKKKHPSVFPCYNFTTGKKVTYLTDEEQVSFVDEHGGPFSWKTKSQMNLKIPDNKNRQVSKVVEDKLLENWDDINQKSLHSNLYKQSKSHLNSSEKSKLSNSSQSSYNKDKEKFVQNISYKITDKDLSINHVSLQDISSSKLSLHSSSSSDSDDFLLNKKSVIEERSDIAMKSGYDFLDNW